MILESLDISLDEALSLAAGDLRSAVLLEKVPPALVDLARRLDDALAGDAEPGA